MCIYYHNCRNRGFMTRMKKSIVQKWISGVQQEVNRLTCPCCGHTEVEVKTHGTSVTSTKMSQLQSL